MSYEDFSDRFDNVRSQHNVMALVGNGFDIQVLSGLGETTDTRYESFYHYLKFRKFDSNNRILQRMEQLRGHAENWSDIEAAIGHLLDSDRVSADEVISDLNEMQREFSSFLDQVATPDVLSRVGELVVSNQLTMTTFTEFLGDIADPAEYCKMRFPQRFDIGDLLNFKFINFNYTTMLDDFVYLDQRQFDPHPHRGSDRNINFHPNPLGHPRTSAWHTERKGFIASSYLVSEVVHPHGIQSTPRSLLFGIDESAGDAQKLSKPYWAQNLVKYGSLFAETHLFIIFGCSLGATDRWWWRAIVQGLQENDDADLIIYRRQSASSPIAADRIRSEFAEAAGCGGDRGILSLLADKARVVLYGDATERAWLNSNEQTKPSWVWKSPGSVDTSYRR